MAFILLTSEKFVKEATSVSDNLDGKYLAPAIREAQEIGLKGILGDALTDKLKNLVASRDIETGANARYKALLDRCQYYLAYKAVSEVAMKTTYKVNNFGVTKSSDTNLQVGSQDEVSKLQYYYESKADSCCIEIQGFLLENRSDYPELSENHCHKIKANLTSAASCGLFLGGARGRRIR